MNHEANKAAAATLRRFVKNVQRWCRITGYGRSTFYAWADEVHPVPAHVIGPTYRAIQKLDFLAEITHANENNVALIKTAEPKSIGDVRDEMMEVGESLGSAMGALRRALKDRVISEAERRELRARLDDVIREAEEAKLSIDPALRLERGGKR
jgi:hypothetical protein